MSSIAFGVAGQLLMKHAALRSIVGLSLSSVSVLALAFAVYSLGIVFWMVALRWLPLSIAYPVTSLSYVGVLWGSWYWFSESISSLRVLGVTLIFIGVTLIVWNKSSAR